MCVGGQSALASAVPPFCVLVTVNGRGAWEGGLKMEEEEEEEMRHMESVVAQ